MAAPVSSGDAPPSYTNGVLPIDKNSGSDLPAYGQIQQSPAHGPVTQSETQEFSYSITKSGHPFVVLTLIGPHAHETPIFIGGSPVKGKIQLHLKKPDSISSVVLTVKGVVLTASALDPYYGHTTAFLNLNHTVWSQDGPHAALQGDYTWPFSIDLPKEVEISEGHQSKMFQLPQTIYESLIAPIVKYDISVVVVRKGILHSNEGLSTPFAYIPNIQPPPLPALRRLAYEEGTPLLGPKVDPEGWFFQKSVLVEGKLFNDRPARVECKLFLANPLSYTRGSVIPLFITLESDDSQLLDLLSAPAAISVRVRRRVGFSSDPLKSKQVFSIPALQTVGEVDHSQRAVWWSATGEDQSDRLRMFEGELHLRPNMVPTSAMGEYSLNYSVVLLPFDTPGFKIDAKHDGSNEPPVYLEQPITVVTAFAPGPRPRMSTPADYTPDIKKDADSFHHSNQFSYDFY